MSNNNNDNEDIRESTSNKRNFFSQFSSKVNKLSQKLILTSPKKNEIVKTEEVVVSFDYPENESFIGVNPLSNNRDSEYRYTEYNENDENYDEEENEDEEENNDYDYEDDDNNSYDDGNDDEDYQNIDDDLFDSDNLKEIQSLLQLFTSLNDIEEDDENDNNNNNDDNRMSININSNNIQSDSDEGIIFTKKHKHKLNSTTELDEIRNRRCDVCKETGGCIYYCPTCKKDDNDFDMCYDCKRLELGDNVTTKKSTIFSVASVFDNNFLEKKSSNVSFPTYTIFADSYFN
jgi:hypothetical protein